MICELEDKIFDLSPAGFDELAIKVFHIQHRDSPIYRSFCDALHIDPLQVDNVASIPFLPVSFFKNHEVATGSFVPEVVFESSGTTATGNSRHLVRSLELYRQSFRRCFSMSYGDVQEWCIIGLLPSYLERENSSLVFMVNDLISTSGHNRSGFYLYDFPRLGDVLMENESLGQKTLLIGVTFALLDFARDFRRPLKHTVIMETGGMKGRRKEITREEVHEQLMSAWALPSIHSEYGMTELLSQAYSKGSGIYSCPPWMKVLLREEDDPLSVRAAKTDTISGLVNVIDLANIHSCSFLAIDDIARLHNDGTFEILGRMDSSDVRGCALMYNL